MATRAQPSKGRKAGGKAPVIPPEPTISRSAEAPTQMAPPGANTPRRKPNRGRDGGRTKSKKVWLTEGENTRLESLAREAGLSDGSYIRAKTLGSAGPRARRLPSIDRELMIRLIAEMNRIGVNINQLARNSNRGREGDEDILTETMREHQRVLTAAWEAMRE
jgi:Bacterial mobilisation protein (MobC)